MVASDDAGALEWQAPGPGRWRREVSHFPAGQTPLYRALYEPGSRLGMADALARYGMAASHLQMAYVNDHSYVRLVPLLEPPGALATRTPPSSAMWLLSRLVPRLRRRTAAARAALENRLWREDGRRWYEEQRPAAEERNLSLQAEPVDRLSDAELTDHVGRALESLGGGIRLHFELVAANFVPLGDLLAHAVDSGVDAVAVLELVRGASPASAETAEALRPVAKAIAAADAAPRTLDDLRALDATAAGALDAYLRRFGHRVVGGYEIDAPTLLELPGVVVAAARRLAEGSAGGVEAPGRGATVEALRANPGLVPLLEEARYGYGIRDDNAGLTLQWPAGLVRRAVLESGRRLVATGRVQAPEHLFELHPDELAGVMHGQPTPTAGEIAARAERRRLNLSVPAPDALGPEEPLPPLEPLPAPLRRVARAGIVAYELLDTAATSSTERGTGVGQGRVRGRARVATDPGEALAVLEPGDVLVVPFTTPAYNTVLPIVSGLVVEEGGALSHAALVARELGIPAVIGLRGATRRIPDGSVVEIDPSAGCVTLVS